MESLLYSPGSFPQSNGINSYSEDKELQSLLKTCSPHCGILHHWPEFFTPSLCVYTFYLGCKVSQKRAGEYFPPLGLVTGHVTCLG